MAGFRDALAALLGVSAYEKPANAHSDGDRLEEIRARYGGSISRPSVQQTRFYVADIEDAILAADRGDLRKAASLWTAMRRDGVMAGLLSTCTDGLVRLPKRFYGDSEQVADLMPQNDTRSVFDEMFPPSELALLAADGIGLGVGIAELMPVQGRDYPVMVRHDPENLRYRWDENRWYFSALGEQLPITPGDGRWILHLPGGRVAPWRNGKWIACGRPFVIKDHAIAYKTNWESKLANPARVAVSPTGASEEQSDSWFRAVMAWGVNTVFGMKPGYDVKLLESNGRGFESFDTTIESANKEYIIAIAGQLVTTTGGAGFQNSDIHKSIRADIIKAIADGLAHTINTQGIPPWVVARWGVDALVTRAIVEWDVAPPKDRLQEANALIAFANAVKCLGEALSPYGRQVDVISLANAHGVPMLQEVAAPPASNQVQEAA
jgi:hypothetical protein